MNHFRAYTCCVSKYRRAFGAPRPGSRRGVLLWVQKAERVLGATGDHSLGRRRGLWPTLRLQPGIDVTGLETEQMAELDGLWKVAATGVAVVDSLLSQPEVGGERLGREELMHGSRYWMQSHDCIQYRCDLPASTVCLSTPSAKHALTQLRSPRRVLGIHWRHKSTGHHRCEKSLPLLGPPQEHAT